MQNNQLSVTNILNPIVPTLTHLMMGKVGGNREYIEARVHQEIENLNYLCLSNPVIAECIPETIKYAIRKVITQGLSFDPDAGLVHITTRNMTIKGPDGKDVIHKKLEVTNTVNGDYSLYKMSKALIGINSPTVTYDEKGYVQSVLIELIVPNGTGGARIMPFTFDAGYFKTLEKYSHKQNSFGKKSNEVNNATLNWANQNYSNYYPENPAKNHSYDDKGGINPGFAITKALKHAFRRAKLDKNPYSVSFDVQHEKIVDPSLDDNEVPYSEAEIVTEYAPAAAPVQPPTPPPAEPLETPLASPLQPPITPPAAVVPPAPVAPVTPPPAAATPTPTPPPAPPAAEDGKDGVYIEILNECQMAKTKEEVNKIYLARKADVQARPLLLKEIKAIISEHKRIEAQNQPAEVSASDL